MKIKVAKRHIEAANYYRYIQRNGVKACHCPVAYAMLELGFDNPSILYKDAPGMIGVDLRKEPWRVTKLTSVPAFVEEIIEKWDKTGKMKPFEFELDL